MPEHQILGNDVIQGALGRALTRFGRRFGPPGVSPGATPQPAPPGVSAPPPPTQEPAAPQRRSILEDPLLNELERRLNAVEEHLNTLPQNHYLHREAEQAFNTLVDQYNTRAEQLHAQQELVENREIEDRHGKVMGLAQDELELPRRPERVLAGGPDVPPMRFGADIDPAQAVLIRRRAIQAGTPKPEDLAALGR